MIYNVVGYVRQPGATLLYHAVSPHFEACPINYAAEMLTGT
jgi:hypothetical protein